MVTFPVLKMFRIVLLVWLAFHMPGMAVPPLLVVSPEMPTTDLADYVSFRLTETGELAPADVMASVMRGEFTPAGGRTLSFGFTGKDLWLAMRMQASGDRTRDLVVDVGSPRIQGIEWFVWDGGAVAEPVLLEGRMGIRHPRIVLSVPPDNEAYLLVRVRSKNAAILLPMTASQPEEYAAWLERQLLWQFGHFGFIFSVCLITGLIGVVQRKPFYLMLSGICLFYLLHDFSYHHYQKLFGFPATAWFNLLMVQVAALGYFILMQIFTLRYIGYHRVDRRLRRLVIGVCALVVFSAIVLPFIPFNVTYHLTLLLASMGFVIGTAVAGYESIRLRDRGIRLVFFAWALASCSTVVVSLQWMAVIPVLLPPSVILRMMNPPLLILFILAIHDHQRTERKQADLLAESRQRWVDAQLEALRYQLNPHFLYNTLNALAGLAADAPERIPHLVERLATFLRLRLKPAPDSMTCFARELDIARAYLEIEQVRMEERLQVSYAIEAGLDHIRLPELLLQPLLENAIKHGAPLDGVLHIRVRACLREGMLRISVQNTGALAREAAGREGGGESIGLQNVVSRIRHAYGTAAQFEIAGRDGWVTASLVLPAEGIP